jgi:general stress protein YciG
MVKIPSEVLEFFKKEGRRGGKTSSDSMTIEQRRERARKAGLASGKTRAKNAALVRKAKGKQTK